MSETLIWLFIFLTAYWAYCGFFGIRGLRRTSTAEGFFLASRGLATWVYAMAATVASVAGLVIVMQPGIVYRDGFQAMNAGALAIGLPLAGVVLLKRQRMISQEFGLVTQGEMFARYFGNDGVRLVSVGTALLFAVPFSALLLGSTGFVFSELSGGAVSRTAAMWVLSAVVLFYVVTGGLRAVANIGVVQCTLFAAVAAFCGAVAFSFFGGFESFNLALSSTIGADVSQWGNTNGNGGGSYNGYFAVPGVIQFTRGLGVEAPDGGPWTSVMSLTYTFALMGVLASPAFSMFGAATRSARGFAVQQVWLTGVGVGLLLLFFVSTQGLAAHLLGANADLNQANLNTNNALSVLEPGEQARVIVEYLKVFQDTAPWVLGFFGICVVAAIHATVAIFLLNTSTVLMRDIYRNYVDETVSDEMQIFGSRVICTILMVATLLMATYLTEAAQSLSALTLSFSFQLWPALLAITWLHWLPSRAVLLGLIAGLVAVLFTEPLGQTITGNTLPWGRWPWTIHSAGWGIFFNILVCVIVTLSVRRGSDEGAGSLEIRDFLNRADRQTNRSPRLKSVAWLFALIWLFFAIGPGTVIGNDLFGSPDSGIEAWMFRMPSIWAWQIIWWALGVGMIWFLAYKMELASETGNDRFSTPELTLNAERN